MKKRNLLLIGFALMLLAALIVPWKHIVEDRLKSEMAAHGVNAEFTLDTIGIVGLTFKNIRLQSPLPLAVDELSVDYSLFTLLRGNVEQVKLGEIKFKKPPYVITAKEVLLQVGHGNWTVGQLDIAGTPVEIPPLSGGGKWSANSEIGKINGAFKNDGGEYNAAFELFYDRAHSEKSQFTVLGAALPWNGGILSTQKAIFPLDGGTATIPLRLKNISLDVLMKLLTGDRATATGLVSGEVPLRITNGQLLIGKGSLQAKEAGTIIVAPEAIPGDNQQVDVVREILKNFHYNQFAMTTGGEHDKLSILLQLSGNNPEVYNGREVKLNVNLTGDVLSMLQQSILPMGDPKQWLEKK